MLPLVIVGGVIFFAFKQINSSSFINYGEPSNYKIHALNIPNEVEFAGERVRLEEPDLLERMDKELLVNTYWQSNTVLMLKRANKFFPKIEKILREEGVPDDFKYLALIESGLENVTSSAGAKGFWQILRTTGREYGLEVNSNVDERYNIELAHGLHVLTLKKLTND